MVAPGSEGAWTTIGLDEEGLVALKDVILTASLTADEMLAGTDEQKQAGHKMHEDIETVCEAIGTDLDSLWDEFEQTRRDAFIAYARATSPQTKER